MPPELTPDLLLAAYTQGAFPMGRGRDDPEMVWLSPRMRGVLPLDGIKISRSLKKALRKTPLQITADGDFAAVGGTCAAPASGREDT